MFYCNENRSQSVAGLISIALSYDDNFLPECMGDNIKIVEVSCIKSPIHIHSKGGVCFHIFILFTDEDNF